MYLHCSKRMHVNIIHITNVLIVVYHIIEGLSQNTNDLLVRVLTLAVGVYHIWYCTNMSIVNAICVHVYSQHTWHLQGTVKKLRDMTYSVRYYILGKHME